MKTDAWFVVALLLLSLFVIIDGWLTIKGMREGYKEGNGLVRWAMKVFGVVGGVMFWTVISLGALFIVGWLRHSIPDGNNALLGFLWFGVGLGLASRAYVIGQWTMVLWRAAV